MITIRRGKQEDAYEFAVLGKQFVREINYPFKYDMEWMVDNFKVGVTSPNYVFLVAEKDDEIIGFLMGCVNLPIFSQDRVAVELGWYVSPEHRDGSTALKLMDQFEKWAKSQGARHVTMVDIDTVQDLGPIYRRRGYTLTEKTYVKEL